MNPEPLPERNEAWDVYVQKAEVADKELVESWERGIDVLLVFAALFSGVVSAFVLQSYPLLQPDKTDITNELLQELSRQLRNLTSTSSPADTTTVHVSVSALWINGLWFGSLICSLSTALFAIVARQWVQAYKQWMSHQYHDNRARARLRHFRCLGIHGWNMFAILAALPLVLQFALIPFFAGVVIYIARSSGHLAIAVGALLAIVCTIYITTIVLPFFDVQCPYRILPINAIPEIIADKETSAIGNSGHVLDAQILVSLLSNQMHQFDDIVIKAVGSNLLPKLDCRVRDVLREARLWELVEDRYKELLQIFDTPTGPIVKIDPKREDDAYNCLHALHYLSSNDARPFDWKPSSRVQASLEFLRTEEDINKRVIVLAVLNDLASHTR